MSRRNKQRVVWEIQWENEIKTVDHPGLQGQCFATPGNCHHQGMHMADKDQLVNWKERGPKCEFDRPALEHGCHRERTSGAMNLFCEKICNVTQLIPLDSLEDFHVHHMPDKNCKRKGPDHAISTMDLHKQRMKVLLRANPDAKLWVDEKSGAHNGIKMCIDKNDPKKSVPFELSLHQQHAS